MLLDPLPTLASLAPPDARRADARTLAALLRQAREHTLAVFADFERALPALRVPHAAELNPPLWELGHIGWFQEFWIGRNSAWRAGARADPHASRSPPLLANADALYDSSTVPHAARWSLPLPDAVSTRNLLARQLDRTLRCLDDAGPDDDSLYFFRLALLHEAMHGEAAVYMAQSLGIPLSAAIAPRPIAGPRGELDLPATRFTLGSTGNGFAFDNELPAHDVTLEAFRIDSAPVRWRDFLPFIDDGGYEQRALWSEAGQAWLRQSQTRAPRHLRRRNGAWEAQRLGRWLPLELDAPACHITCHEAEAWCLWAGRRLPTEAEWEYAAATRGDAFDWGSVWEWTASPFAPYPGFAPHPYRDYSAPWFGTRRTLRGASCATLPMMCSPRYRNFFEPDRNDIHAGFRSCAL